MLCCYLFRYVMKKTNKQTHTQTNEILQCQQVHSQSLPEKDEFTATELVRTPPHDYHTNEITASVPGNLLRPPFVKVDKFAQMVWRSNQKGVDGQVLFARSAVKAINAHVVMSVVIDVTAVPMLSVRLEHQWVPAT